MLKNNKGFSLIEILVTVGLVGILASIAVPSYQGYKKNTMKMAMRSDVSNGLKVYSAKYAIDGEYCYTFADVGLSTDKSSSPIYKNKGFYGFGDNGTCTNVEVGDVQFISDGTGKCEDSGMNSVPADSKTDCVVTAGNSWKVTTDTEGSNAGACILNTNDFIFGAYSNVSNLETFIQAKHTGEIKEKKSVTNCF